MKVFLAEAQNIPADALLPYLSQQRKEKAAAIKDPHAASVCAQAELLLAYALGKRDATDFAYGFSENGKPYLLEYDGVHFNLSHSKDFILLGFGETELGVDIEQKKDFSQNLPKRIFPKQFLEYFESSYSSQDTFFKLWCAKEALIKCTARALFEKFEDFSFEFSKDTIKCTKNGAVLYISSFNHGELFGAVCSDVPYNTEQIQTLNLSDYFHI